jgi:hypothetical protein
VAVERGLTVAIGDALLSFVEWAVPRISSRVDEWIEKIGDVVRPDPPMSVRTMDGLVLTGLLVVDRGQAVLFIGTRSPPSGGLPPRFDDRSRRYDDGSVPLWARDVDPRDLRDLEVDPYRRR